jgi:hypothetical protein
VGVGVPVAEAEKVMFVEHWPGAVAAVMLLGQVIVGRVFTVAMVEPAAEVQPFTVTVT